MFNITNIQSTARHQSISNEASTEVPLKEEIWNKISAFFSSEHQVEAQSCIAYLCHPPETASPEEIKSKFECLRELAFPDAPRDKRTYFREINYIAAAFQYQKKNYNSA